GLGRARHRDDGRTGQRQGARPHRGRHHDQRRPGRGPGAGVGQGAGTPRWRVAQEGHRPSAQAGQRRGVTSFLLRARARTAWRAWVALGLLLAVASGVALASIAAARRTASAYPRYLAAAQAPDLVVEPPFDAAETNIGIDV